MNTQRTPYRLRSCPRGPAACARLPSTSSCRTAAACPAPSFGPLLRTPFPVKCAPCKRPVVEGTSQDETKGRGIHRQIRINQDFKKECQMSTMITRTRVVHEKLARGRRGKRGSLQIRTTNKNGACVSKAYVGTSTKLDPDPIAPKSKQRVFPCFMAITARRLASSMALLATTFSALCFLRLHDSGSSSTTTPLYL